MSRRKSAIPFRRWHLTIEEPVARQLDLLLHNPLTSSPRAGARSQLINFLLREALASINDPSREFNGSTLRSLIQRGDPLSSLFSATKPPKGESK